MSVQASSGEFRWFVLEKRTPYEACVEPYQHVAPRGATGSPASTRVFIFSEFAILLLEKLSANWGLRIHQIGETLQVAVFDLDRNPVLWRR